MFFGKKKVIGLDIGTSTIKVAEIELSRRSAQLVSFGIVQTPPGAMVSGDVVDPQSVATSIRRLLEEVQTKRDHVCTGLSGSSVIIKKISVPHMAENLLAEQIKWEAEQYVPYDVNEVNLSYKILKNISSSSDTMDVLLIAAVQQYVFKVVEIIETAQLSCAILDVNGFALANCFERNYGVMNGEVVGLLNVGASVTNFVVVENGEVIFCRDIPIAGNTYTSDVQKSLNISQEEAEAIKISYSEGQPAPEEAVEIIKATHETFADEINNSIEFFMNTNTAKNISRYFITGGGSKMLGLKEQLSKNLPFERLNPFQNIKPNGRAFSSEYLRNIADYSAVSIGLGLREPGDT